MEIDLARAEAFAEAADYVDEMLQGFITMPTKNPPEWDRAQARILAHVERWLRERADSISLLPPGQ